MRIAYYLDLFPKLFFKKHKLWLSSVFLFRTFFRCCRGYAANSANPHYSSFGPNYQTVLDIFFCVMIVIKILAPAIGIFNAYLMILYSHCNGYVDKGIKTETLFSFDLRFKHFITTPTFWMHFFSGPSCHFLVVDVLFPNFASIKRYEQWL